jgi:hypothetical protein
MLTKAILGRGKGRWHLDGYDGDKPSVINLKPIEELLEYCPDGTIVYDGKQADSFPFRQWCIYGAAFSLENADNFLESLRRVPGVGWGIVKNGRIVGKVRADCVEIVEEQ